jgi:hypothetical protein
LGIWIQASEVAGHVSSSTYFLNLLEDKDRRLKIKLTLSLILRRCLQKYSDACSTRLQRARGLVRPGHTGLSMWHTSPMIRDRT